MPNAARGRAVTNSYRSAWRMQNGIPDAKDEQGNPIKEAQWGECEIYVKPENSAEGIVNLLKKGRFIYVEAYDKVEAWLDKENKPRARVIYRVTNFQV